MMCVPSAWTSMKKAINCVFCLVLMVCINVDFTFEERKRHTHVKTLVYSLPLGIITMCFPIVNRLSHEMHRSLADQEQENLPSVQAQSHPRRSGRV